MLVTLWGLLALAALSSLGVWYAAGQILEAAHDPHTHALFITDDGFKADSQAMEGQLNDARAGLIAARTQALALFGGCLALGAALVWRVVRGVGRDRSPPLKPN